MLRTHSIHTDIHRRAAWSYSLLSYVQANPAVTHQDLCCAVLCCITMSHVPCPFPMSPLSFQLSRPLRVIRTLRLRPHPTREPVRHIAHVACRRACFLRQVAAVGDIATMSKSQSKLGSRNESPTKSRDCQLTCYTLASPCKDSHTDSDYPPAPTRHQSPACRPGSSRESTSGCVWDHTRARYATA